MGLVLQEVEVGLFLLGAVVDRTVRRPPPGRGTKPRGKPMRRSSRCRLGVEVESLPRRREPEGKLELRAGGVPAQWRLLR